MSVELRRELEAGGRALEFMQAHAFDTAQEQQVVGQLEALTTEARETQVQVQAGEAAARAAVRERQELLGRIARELLRPIARVAAAARKEVPELAKLPPVPKVNGNLQDYRGAAQAIAEQAIAQREVLVQHGLATTLPDDLTAALARLDELSLQVHAGRRAHVGGREKLADIGRRILAVVRQLDGMNLYRFRNDPELRAAWRSAKRVSWPAPPEKAEPAA